MECGNLKAEGFISANKLVSKFLTVQDVDVAGSLDVTGADLTVESLLVNQGAHTVCTRREPA